ncbi:unnamed protein product [Urochloa humidicola]
MTAGGGPDRWCVLSYPTLQDEEVLGVDKKASQRDIQKAFHKISLRYHPNKNKGKGAPEKFKEINNAHEILSNEEKRKTMTYMGMRKVTLDSVVEILETVRVIHTSLAVAPRPAISHLVMDGRQWVVREMQNHFPFHLVVILEPVVETHLLMALILVMFSLTYLVVDQWAATNKVDQLVQLEPILELLVSVLALSRFSHHTNFR